MKILLLGDINSSHTLKWANALSENGYNVAVFTLSPPRETLQPGVQFFSGDIDVALTTTETGWHKIIYIIKGLKVLRKAVKSFKPDVVHAHYASSYGLLGALLNFKPYFVSVWGSDVFVFPSNFIKANILKFVLKRAGVVFSTSYYMAMAIKRFTHKEIIITPFGVDTEKFNLAPPIQKPYIHIGIVKSLEPMYGINHLINGFATFVEKYKIDARLSIAGKGSQLEMLKKLVADKGLTDKVVFIGFLEPGEIINFYKSLDIFVGSSVHESFGVALLEAMSCGLPVIANDIDAYREIDGGFKALQYVNITNDGEVADMMYRLGIDPALRANLGHQSRKIILDRFDFSNNLKIITQQYNNCLNESNHHNRG